jgi:eukaryotic-like serine/threonine-protein kinase
MIGNKIHGCYQIVKTFKKGAFGKTYLAEYHPDLEADTERSEGAVTIKYSWFEGDRCILKILQTSSNHPYILDEAKQRFNNEVKKLEKLGHHPQIPSLLDFFIDKNQLCVVEEFIDGQDLSQEICEGKSWPESQVIALLYNVLEVLEVIHEQETIHRNIKPSNLIRRFSDYQIVPIDFGSLKEIETLVLSFGGNVTTSMIGTPGYMPIEQLGGRVYPNSDIYALGITAIQALTGMHPTKLERDIKSGELIWQHLVQCRQELIDILTLMVHPDWEQRYQSATDVLRDLQGFHEIGETIENRYKIINFLGESSFCKTYLTLDRERGNSPCVLKKIEPHKVDPFPFWEARILFDTEAQNLQRLGTHDRIPRLLDDFPGESVFYLVHEFVQGKSLAEEMNERRWKESEAIALLQDVLHTLTFVHQQNVIHSNIHPANLIRRSSDSQLVLLDFGSVKQISTMALDDQGQLINTGSVGTVGYMPKEQQAGNLRPNSDIYALGMMAIQALTGVHPSQLETDPLSGEVSWRHLTQVSDRLATIIDKMAHAYFRERYQSAAEVLKDLALLPGALPGTLPGTQSFAENLAIISSSEPTVVQSVSQPQPPATENASSGDRHKSNSPSNSEATPPEVSPEHSLITTVTLPFSEKIWLWILSVTGGILALVALIGGLVVWNNAEKNRRLIVQADAIIQQASAQLDLRQALEAEELCDRAQAIKPDYSNAWKCRGDALFLLQRYPAALVAYQKATELEPKNPKFWNNQGEVYSQLSNYNEALAAHDRALKLDPRNAQAKKGRAIALIGLRKYPEALAELLEGVSFDPEEPTLWEYQGLVQERLEKPQESVLAYEEAVAVYDRKLESKPNDLILWIERGRILSKIRRYEDALDSYERALKINPKFYLAWNAKATTFYEMEKFQLALEAYDQTVELNPNFYIGWHNRASLLSVGLERYADAVKSYDRALKINPSFYHAWRDRGIALAEIKQYEEAIKSFDEAIKIEANDYPSWVSRGMALTELQRDEEALVSFNRAIEIYPNDPFAWTQRGLSLEYLKRTQEAIASYNKAIEIQPNFTPAINARSRLR